MATAAPNFNRAFVNFKAQLNQIFQDELVLVKQDCLNLESLSDVFTIEQDTVNYRAVFTAARTATIGAQYEVRQVAKLLAKKYKIKLQFR